MARDRMFFIASFAVLLLIAAFLFRSPERKTVDTPIKTIQAKPVKLTEAIQPDIGKIAVPLLLTKRSGIIEFLAPGKIVDVIFTSNADVGFGTISVILMENIRVLGIGKDSAGKKYTDIGSYYKANTPTEVLLEMTPRQAEVFSFAEESGSINLAVERSPTPWVDPLSPLSAIKTKLPQRFNLANRFDKIVQNRPPERYIQAEKNALVEELMRSKSDQSFNSILITHMIQQLVPEARIKITAAPNGFIVAGKIPNAATGDKILKVLNFLTTKDRQTIVNLMQEDRSTLEAIDTIQKVTSFSVPEGSVIVPFGIPANSPMLTVIKPGAIVDINFTSRNNVGINAVNLIILRGITVLDVGQNFQARPAIVKGEKIGTRGDPNPIVKETVVAPALVEVLLEMTPKQADILSYAQAYGNIVIMPGRIVFDEETPELEKKLLQSTSEVDFYSTLITYMIRTIFPYADIRVTASNKGWILEGRVSDPQVADKIIEILTKLIPDKVVINLLDVQPQQILLSVVVFEVFKDVRERVGLNWQVLWDHCGQALAFGAVFPRPPAIEPNYFLSASGFNSGQFSFSGVIDMLEREGFAKILAEPNLTTLAGAKASFFAGGEFPIIVPQGGTLLGTVTVEFKKYGVMLDFEPTVDLNNLITLHVRPEVSTLDRANGVVIQGFVIPGLLTRRVETTVKLWPGQSYIIGGMYLYQFDETVDSLYGLNQLPLIGPLFNSKNCHTAKTELMVMVTPYLMNDNNTARPNEDCVTEHWKNTCQINLNQLPPPGEKMRPTRYKRGYRKCRRHRAPPECRHSMPYCNSYTDLEQIDETSQSMEFLNDGTGGPGVFPEVLERCPNEN